MKIIHNNKNIKSFRVTPQNILEIDRKINSVEKELTNLKDKDLVDKLNEMDIFYKIAEIIYNDLGVTRPYGCYDPSIIEDVKKGAENVDYIFSDNMSKILEQIEHILKINEKAINKDFYVDITTEESSTKILDMLYDTTFTQKNFDSLVKGLHRNIRYNIKSSNLKEIIKAIGDSSFELKNYIKDTIELHSGVSSFEYYMSMYKSSVLSLEKVNKKMLVLDLKLSKNKVKLLIKQFIDNGIIEKESLGKLYGILDIDEKKELLEQNKNNSEVKIIFENSLNFDLFIEGEKKHSRFVDINETSKIIDFNNEE